MDRAGQGTWHQQPTRAAHKKSPAISRPPHLHTTSVILPPHPHTPHPPALCGFPHTPVAVAPRCAWHWFSVQIVRVRFRSTALGLSNPFCHSYHSCCFAAAKRRRLEALPAPSSMAKSTTWQDVQRQNSDHPLFICFRSGGTTALPVGLYAPELDLVVDMFRKVSGTRIKLLRPKGHYVGVHGLSGCAGSMRGAGRTLIPEHPDVTPEQLPTVTRTATYELHVPSHGRQCGCSSADSGLSALSRCI